MLKGDLAGLYSIRINSQFRIVFRFERGDASAVRIVDYHCEAELMLPKNRPPTAPGTMLLEEFLKPRGISQVQLAERMGVPVQRVNTIINGKRGITAETAILLSEVLETTPEFWLGLQTDSDLWRALRERESQPDRAGRRTRAPATASRRISRKR